MPTICNLVLNFLGLKFFLWFFLLIPVSQCPLSSKYSMLSCSILICILTMSWTKLNIFNINFGFLVSNALSSIPDLILLYWTTYSIFSLKDTSFPLNAIRYLIVLYDLVYLSDYIIYSTLDILWIPLAHFLKFVFIELNEIFINPLVYNVLYTLIIMLDSVYKKICSNILHKMGSPKIWNLKFQEARWIFGKDSILIYIRVPDLLLLLWPALTMYISWWKILAT